MNTDGTRPGVQFRPRLWQTLAMLPVLAVLIGLGTWQMQRLGWKTELIARMQTRMAMPMEPLPGSIPVPDDWDYRPVMVTGTFLHDRELHLGPRTLVGEDGVTVSGVHVLTPLTRSDGRGTVLIDRGFVPGDLREPARREAGRPVGEVTVTGIARVPTGRAPLQLDNRPAENFWFWIDLDAMAAATGVGPFSPLLVQAGGEPVPGGWPRGGRTVVQVKNDHLAYAATWYGLALTLVGVWIAVSLRRPSG